MAITVYSGVQQIGRALATDEGRLTLAKTRLLGRGELGRVVSSQRGP